MTDDADAELRADGGRGAARHRRARCPRPSARWRSSCCRATPPTSAPAMLEIRAGTGGDEAALFAGDLFRMYQRYRRGAGLAGRADLGQRVRRRRLQGSRRLDHRQRRVRQAEVRKRRPPRPARAGDRKRRAHPHLGGDRRGAARGRGGRRPDRRQGPADRRLPLVGAGRPVGQHHRQRGPHHPSCRPASSSSSRTRNRSTRTRPRR